MLTQQLGAGQPHFSERRTHPRQPVIGHDIMAVSVGPGRTSGLVIDLSEAGMRFQAFAPLKSGSREQLRWNFPSENSGMSVISEIAWSDMNDLTGVKFLDLDDRGLAQIASYLRSAGPSESKLQTQLGELVEHARVVTCARGTAIAIASGYQFVCRASNGAAPSVDVVIDREKGLSAQCLRSGEMVYCSDTKNDPRVDGKLCEALGLRSALLLPLKMDDCVIGVLLCLWDQPNGCSNFDRRQLGIMAERAARLLCPRSRASTHQLLSC
jgi:hypothetical protein